MDRKITLARAAERDLDGIERYLGKVASSRLAETYVMRILDFIGKLRQFPERGSLRDDIRPGLRMIGFERRVSVVFTVGESEVTIVRILYGGRQIDSID
jgi:toxin ParE1/3/4